MKTKNNGAQYQWRKRTYHFIVPLACRCGAGAPAEAQFAVEGGRNRQRCCGFGNRKESMSGRKNRKIIMERNNNGGYKHTIPSFVCIAVGGRQRRRNSWSRGRQLMAMLRFWN